MNNRQITLKMLATMEFLPACRMNLYWAGVRAGYSPSYARKLARRCVDDPRLRELVIQRVQRVLQEAGESDRDIVAKLLQRQHVRAHPVNAVVFAPLVQL